MRIQLLKGKIHRATCTKTDMNYTGSITIDEDLMDAAGIVAYERVLVANISNGTRHETYAVVGTRGSGDIVVMGAAAHLVSQGDKLIIMVFADFDSTEASKHKPKVIFVDDENKIITG